MTTPSSPLEFFRHLNWLDGRPLLETIEPYRRKIFEDVLYTFGDDGAPRYNMALCGRAKKNWKTSDLVLAALYRFLVWPSDNGNDILLLANDEGQAADDLSLVKKLIGCNPLLAQEVTVKAKQIDRNDGKGKMLILPAKDIAGSHGKTYLFCGFDEIHGYKDHSLFEALAPDPTRRDVLTWITSYAGIRHSPGVPLFDYLSAAKRGDDPRLYFSWYAGDYSTDAALAEATPEQRANPSLASWGDDGYLAQQRQRLPTSKYRRLHLNLPGAPVGAAFSAEHVVAAIVPGRKRLPRADYRYFAGVDMSGGSSDHAVLAIAHMDPETKRAVLDSLIDQGQQPPFSTRAAVRKFAHELMAYGLARVSCDAYAGLTHRQNFLEHGTVAEVTPYTKHQLYEALEPRLNAGEVELLDHPQLQEQLLTLVYRGAKIDHQPGDHDDHANAAALALKLAADVPSVDYARAGHGGLVGGSDYPRSNPNDFGPVDHRGPVPGNAW
jgi:hypothetical protein